LPMKDAPRFTKMMSANFITEISFFYLSLLRFGLSSCGGVLCGSWTTRHRSSPELAGARRSSPELTRAHRSSPELATALRSSPELTGAHRSSPELTRAHRSSPELTGAHRSSPELTGAHRSSPELTGARRSSLELTHTWPLTNSKIIEMLRFSCFLLLHTDDVTTATEDHQGWLLTHYRKLIGGQMATQPDTNEFKM
jgi:hypothetical protein